jgi:predicted membrane protein
MHTQGRMLLGIVVVVFGLLLLLGALFDLDPGTFFCPGILILVGAWLIFRALTHDPGTTLGTHLFGPVRRDGVWPVIEEEIWVVLGDVKLDFSQAEIPEGETTIRIFSFLGKVRALVPADVGIAVATTALINDVRLADRKRSGFVTLATLASDDYETAPRRVRLETTHLISDVRVKGA